MANRYGLEIRSAAPPDAAGLSELLSLCGTAVDARTMGERLEALNRADGAALLAQEWGPPSGVIVLSWRPVLQADAPQALITSLLVAPDARRRGIGRLLLKAAAQAARQAGCGELHLLAPPAQYDLEAFCGATGFVASGSTYVRSLRKGR